MRYFVTKWYIQSISKYLKRYCIQKIQTTRRRQGRHAGPAPPGGVSSRPAWRGPARRAARMVRVYIIHYPLNPLNHIILCILYHFISNVKRNSSSWSHPRLIPWNMKATTYKYVYQRHQEAFKSIREPVKSHI